MMIILYLCLFIVSLAVYYKAFHRRRRNDDDLPRSFGFFHPYCSAGGGGERVLWHMVRVLQQQQQQQRNEPPLKVYIYTVDPPSSKYKTDLIDDIQTRFSISIRSDSLEFVHLHAHKDLLLPAPRFSLIVESWNTMRLARQALLRRIPDVWVDTTGCAFTFAVAAVWFGVQHTLAFVHYPTISTDMLRVVFERRGQTNDDNKQQQQPILQSLIKCAYYCCFALLYSIMGCFISCALVNSTWTYNHMASLWWYAAFRKRIHIVFPPCGSLEENERNESKKKSIELHHKQPQQYIISIGQFRPEKDHALQIKVMHALLQRHPGLQGKVQLIVIGSCRGQTDDDRLTKLRALATKQGLDDASIQFVVNEPYSVVQDWLHKAHVGIHTMWNEHFGIGIVEMMAAGVLVVAHDSGGPQSDIVVPHEGQRSGFLASTVNDYVAALYKALTMPTDESDAVRAAARESTKRFTDAVFAKSIENALRDAKVIH